MCAPNIRRKGYSLSHPAPANRRVIHDNSVVLGGCSWPTKQQQQHVGPGGEQGQVHGHEEEHGQEQQQQQHHEQQQQGSGSIRLDEAVASADCDAQLVDRGDSDSVDASACSQFRADQLYATNSKKVSY